MQRKQDIALAEICDTVEQASRNAIAWFERHPQLIGNRSTQFARKLRKISVRARKLAGAARRPMSVAVYGVSQVGKSFLTNTMTSPEKKPTKMLVGPQGSAIAMDYGEEINPQGGKETTGLVTRFSVRPMDGPTAEYPVALRILRETDVLKILVNTHAKDLKMAWETGKSATAANLNGIAQKITEDAHGSAAVSAGMKSEDVVELRQYVETSLPHHPLAAGGDHPEANSDPSNVQACEAYWTALEKHISGMSPTQRELALGPLWGELNEFTDLYRMLKNALEQLGHSEWAFAPLHTIQDREYGVLHVQTLFGMDPNHAASLSGPAAASLTNISVMSGETKRAISLPQPVVTALTRELRLTMEHLPWAFFEHADILDFPGARSRGGNSVGDLRGEGAANTRSECYLRGKVDVLFDAYVDELEANSLLLMMSDKPLEVVELPNMVQDWVYKTHGETPQQRQDLNNSLFLVAACADTLFVQKGGASDFAHVISNRLEANLGEFGSWKDEWVPGRPFQNTYLFRNPSYPAHHIAQYSSKEEGQKEIGYANGFDAVRDRFTADFLNDAIVKKYFEAPQQKLEACLELNDGGVTLLAESLAPVCDPDLKYSQIHPAIKRLAADCLELVEPFFESGDIQSLIEERQAIVKSAIQALGRKEDQIGPLIEKLQTSVAAMRSSYFRYKAEENEIEGSPDNSNPLLDAVFGSDEPEEEVSSKTGFGHAAVSSWRDQLAAVARNENLSESLSMPQEVLTGLVREVLGTGDRAKLVSQIDTLTANVEAVPRPPRDLAYRIGLSAAEIINETVLTFKTEPEQKAKGLAAPDYPVLPEAPAEIETQRRKFLIDWLKGLLKAAELNARGGKGSLIDPDENRKLGDIVDCLKGAANHE